MPLLVTAKMLGAAGLASYALARLSMHQRWIGWSRKHVVAVPVDALPPMPAGYTVRDMTADELSRHQIDIDGAAQATRFAQGLTCVAAFNRKDQLCGVIWLANGSCVEDGMPVRFVPPADAGFDTGMWIAPSHRLGRAFAALWAGVGAWLSARGLAWSISTIADYNFSSMAAHRRLGMIDLGCATFASLASQRWLKLNDGQGWQRVDTDERADWCLSIIGDPVGQTDRLAPAQPG